eukprot:3321191-Pleurochrysis_carterae.AAC.2
MLAEPPDLFFFRTLLSRGAIMVLEINLPVQRQTDSLVVVRAYSTARPYASITNTCYKTAVNAQY